MKKDHTPSHGTPLTRRHALKFGATLGSGILLGAGSCQIANAQGTPPASPVDNGYVHPEALVDAAWLQDYMDDPGMVVVAFMPLDEAETARIPGALQIDWPELEVIDTSDASIASWETTTQEMIGDLGITPESTVVVYDNGTLFAARLWWILRYFGHENVITLNGGLAAWQAAGKPTDSGPIVRTMIKHPPYEGTPNADLLAQMDEVLAVLDDPGVVIIDARTPEEYAEGHIPGAVNLNYPLNAAPESPKVYKPADELRAMYDAIGVTSDTSVIPYCTSGVRSAVTTFSLHLIGHDDVALYTGSWLEWGEDPDAPKTTGDQP